MTIKPLLKTEYSKLLRLCNNADITISRLHIEKEGHLSRLNFMVEMDVIYTTFWDSRFSLCKKVWTEVRKAHNTWTIPECDEDIAI